LEWIIFKLGWRLKQLWKNLNEEWIQWRFRLSGAHKLGINKVPKDSKWGKFGPGHLVWSNNILDKWGWTLEDTSSINPYKRWSQRVNFLEKKSLNEVSYQLNEIKKEKLLQLSHISGEYLRKNDIDSIVKRIIPKTNNNKNDWKNSLERIILKIQMEPFFPVEWGFDNIEDYFKWVLKGKWNSIKKSTIFVDASWRNLQQAGIGIVGPGMMGIGYRLLGAKDSGIAEAMGILVTLHLLDSQQNVTIFCDNFRYN